MSNHTIRRQTLDPEAQIFRPRSEFNALANPFIPGVSSIEVKHSVYIRRLSWNVHAAVFVPKAYQTDVDNRKTLRVSSNSISTNRNTLREHSLPKSPTRQRAETGQTVKRPLSWEWKRSPSKYPLPNGAKPSFVPAGSIAYNGALEDQRQRFQLSQSEEQEIRYNWMGRPSCANGESISKDVSDMSEEAQKVESVVQPRPVHHFNWLGQAVPFKSTTPPAVSLVVIMSLLKPKGLSYGSFQKDLCKATLFNNALATVDPVIYNGDDDGILVDLRGSALQEAVTGSVSRMYSKHGSWYYHQLAVDSNDEEKPLHDHLKADDYSEDEAVANGWYSNSNIPTVRDFVEFDSQVNMENALRRRMNVLERLNSSRTKSNLTRVIHAREIDGTTNG